MPIIELIDGTQYQDVDLIAIVIDRQTNKPMFGPKSVCYFNHQTVTSTPTKVGKDIHTIARHDKAVAPAFFSSLECTEQIEWDERYAIALAISCYDHTFKNWDGYVNITAESGQLIGSFETNELGDLSGTRCIQLGIIGPAEKINAGWFGFRSKYALPVSGKTTTYAYLSDWLKEFGLDCNEETEKGYARLSL